MGDCALMGNYNKEDQTILVRPRTDIFFTSPTGELLDKSVEEGWFDEDSLNWRLGFGKGLPGAVAHRGDFLSALDRDDKEIKVVGITRGSDPVGFAYIIPTSEEHKIVQIGHLYLEPGVRGTGVAPHVLYKLLGMIFDNGAYRVEMELLRIHKDAIDWLRKQGFTQEAIKRSSRWMDENVFDTVLLRILRPEFRKLYREV